jgi:hypothetical protein
MLGRYLFHYLLCNRTHPLPRHPPSNRLRLFSSQPSPVWIPQLFSNLVILHLFAYEDRTECSETSTYKIQTPGNCPEENIKHTEHGESLKSRIIHCLAANNTIIVEVLLRLYVLIAHHIAVPAETTHTYSSLVR